MSRNTVNIYDRVAGEPVNVPDHPMNRDQEITVEVARREALNDELDPEELPLVVTSDMSADPCEGVQGSYSAIVSDQCSECPSQFGVHQEAHTMAGVGTTECLLCGAMIHDWR